MHFCYTGVNRASEKAVMKMGKNASEKKSDVYCFVYDTSIGKITIASDEETITLVQFGEAERAPLHRCPLIDRAAAEIQEYLNGKRTLFDLPISPRGTDFQKRVWHALRSIPYGETRSYRQIAEQIGSPKAYRAVGMANNKNPVAILIPCHRVIGSDGSLVGYAAGLDIKGRLLALEQANRICDKDA